MSFIYAIIFAIILGAIYALGYYYNSKTDKPVGCEELLQSCNGCKVSSCEHNPNHLKGENHE